MEETLGEERGNLIRNRRGFWMILYILLPNANPKNIFIRLPTIYDESFAYFVIHIFFCQIGHLIINIICDFHEKNYNRDFY